MGSKRSHAKMQRLKTRFYDGAAANGITGDLADMIFGQVAAFAGYGFPEAHSLSFAVLVYVSSYSKLYHPAAYCAGLLNAQPMGFHSPQTLVADARRHGVIVHRPDINVSLARATLEPDPGSTGGVVVRLGLAIIRHVGENPAQAIVDERDAHGLYHDMADLGRRTTLTQPQLEAAAFSRTPTASAASTPTTSNLSNSTSAPPRAETSGRPENGRHHTR